MKKVQIHAVGFKPETVEIDTNQQLEEFYPIIKAKYHFNEDSIKFLIRGQFISPKQIISKVIDSPQTILTIINQSIENNSTSNGDMPDKQQMIDVCIQRLQNRENFWDNVSELEKIGYDKETCICALLFCSNSLSVCTHFLLQNKKAPNIEEMYNNQPGYASKETETSKKEETVSTSIIPDYYEKNYINSYYVSPFNSNLSSLISNEDKEKIEKTKVCLNDIHNRFYSDPRKLLEMIETHYPQYKQKISEDPTDLFASFGYLYNKKEKTIKPAEHLYKGRPLVDKIDFLGYSEKDIKNIKQLSFETDSSIETALIAYKASENDVDIAKSILNNLLSE